jgi:hypothetical protein
MVSRLGFIRQALIVAKAEHIICLSLLPSDPGQTGLAVTATCYHRVGRWENIQMSLHWPNGDKPEIVGSNALDVRYGGKPVILWFLKQLATELVDEMKPGPFGLQLNFDRLVPLEINGGIVQSVGVSFTADRVFTSKRKQLMLYGDAVYDWQNDTLTVPNLGQVFTGPFLADASEFEEFDGDIPAAPADFLEVMLFGHINQYNPDMAVVDLTAL